MPSSESNRPTVAIAGATGFVGSALREALAGSYHVVGLTRSYAKLSQVGEEDPVEWRHCDLFSAIQTEQGLRGADYAVYLVHSMSPSARLSQGSFEDLDLVLADNFARAAERCGIKQILYLTGIVPDEDPAELSAHLRSRYEVERALGSRSTPVTALRAAIVAGPGGSSLRIIVNLVRRLPVMILPAWTESYIQPIALRDVVRAFEFCLGREETFDQAYDVGGPEAMRYREMIERTAEVMNRKRRMISVPISALGLSKLWVSTISGTSRALVDPLIDSLKYDMVVDDNPLQDYLVVEATTYAEALHNALDDDGTLKPHPKAEFRKADRRRTRKARRVRSIQRLPLPQSRDAAWAAQEYIRWLPRFGRPFLRVREVDEQYRVELRPFGLTLLSFRSTEGHNEPDRQVFDVTGGLLAKDPEEYAARLEFREVLGGEYVLSAVHDFSPRLPWYLYTATQAIMHVVAMKVFGRHLRRIAKQAAPFDFRHAPIETPTP